MASWHEWLCELEPLKLPVKINCIISSMKTVEIKGATSSLALAALQLISQMPGLDFIVLSWLLSCPYTYENKLFPDKVSLFKTLIASQTHRQCECRLRPSPHLECHQSWLSCIPGCPASWDQSKSQSPSMQMPAQRGSRL